ncbi:MAG: hypothetical protein ACN6N0_10775, partial [Microvirgula sp.]
MCPESGLLGQNGAAAAGRISQCIELAGCLIRQSDRDDAHACPSFNVDSRAFCILYMFAVPPKRRAEPLGQMVHEPRP